MEETHFWHTKDHEIKKDFHELIIWGDEVYLSGKIILLGAFQIFVKIKEANHVPNESYMKMETLVEKWQTS